MSANTTKFFLLAGSLGGLLAVAAGAFGAHALRERLSPEMLQIWQTAVLYQSIHALALLFVALAAAWKPELGWRGAGNCFVVGIVIFSGSLYALVLSGEKWLGAVTPVGGVAFLLGWIWMIRNSWKIKVAE